MASSRLKKSLRLKNSIIAKWNQSTNSPIAEDVMFVHILDCMGALSCIRKDRKKNNSSKNSSSNNNEEGQTALLSCKHRVFWQAVREIANQEAVLEDTPATEEENKSSLDLLLESFPDETKLSNVAAASSRRVLAHQ